MRKKNSAGIFGSFLEAVAFAGMVIHFFIILFVCGFLPDLFSIPPKGGGAGVKYGDGSDALILFCVSASLYAGLTWLGHFPEKLNYPWKINEKNAGAQHSLAENFLKEIKIELVWLFVLIALQSVPSIVEEFGEFINLSIFLLILIISATVIGYIVTASRSGSNP
jgi:hypothetical protein